MTENHGVAGSIPALGTSLARPTKSQTDKVGGTTCLCACLSKRESQVEALTRFAGRPDPSFLTGATAPAKAQRITRRTTSPYSA
jgi:hypothetical protein